MTFKTLAQSGRFNPTGDTLGSRSVQNWPFLRNLENPTEPILIFPTPTTDSPPPRGLPCSVCSIDRKYSIGETKGWHDLGRVLKCP